MTNQIKGLLYFYIVDMRYNFIIFWSILLGILVLSLVIAYFLLDVEGGFFAFGIPFATYFNVAFVGFFTVKETVPFALKMGAIRKNIFWVTGLFFFGYALLFAIITSALQSLILFFSDLINLHSFRLLHPAELIGNDTWFITIIVDTAVLFFILVLFYLIGLLFYKGGLLAGGSLLGLGAVIVLIGIAQGWLIKGIINIGQNLDLFFFVQIFGLGVVLYGAAYLFLRNISPVKMR